MRKYLGTFLVFAAVCGLLVQIPAMLLPAYWGNPGFVAKTEMLRQNPGAFDTYFLGASTVYRHLDPQIVDSLNPGLHCFNLGYAAVFNPELYRFADNFLANAPAGTRNLVLEMQPLQYIAGDNLPTVRGHYYMDFEVWRSVVAHYLTDDGETWPMRLGGIGTFSLAWFYKICQPHCFREAFRGAFGSGPRRDELAGGRAGNGFFDLETNFHDPNAPEKDRSELAKRRAELLNRPDMLEKRRGYAAAQFAVARRDVPAAQFQIRWLAKLQKRAAEKNIRLVLLVPPRLLANQYRQLREALPKISEELQVVDLSSPEAHPEFYKLETSFDIGHFNAAGARAYSLAFGQALGKLLKTGPN